MLRPGMMFHGFDLSDVSLESSAEEFQPHGCICECLPTAAAKVTG